MDIKFKPLIQSYLFRRVFLSFLALAVLPILIVSYLNFTAYQDNLIQWEEQFLEQIALEKKDNLNEYFRVRISLAELAVRNQSLVYVVRNLISATHTRGLHSDIYHTIEIMYRNLFEDLRVTTSSTNIQVVSPEGYIAYSINEEMGLGESLRSGLLKNYALAETFEAAVASRKSQISTLDIYPPYLSPELFVAVPVLDDEDLVAVVVAQLDVNKFYKQLTDYSGLGSTGEFVLASLNTTGAQVVAPLRHVSKAAFNMTIQDAGEEDLPIFKALRGESGQGYSTDYRNQTVLARWDPMPDLKLGLVVKIDLDELNQPSRILFRNNTITILTVVLLITLISTLLLNMIVSPITQLTSILEFLSMGMIPTKISNRYGGEIGKMYESVNGLIESMRKAIQQATAISVGDFSVHVEARSENDELAFSFKRMTSSFKQLSNAAETILEGDYDLSLEERGDQDLLIRSFNRMVSGLKEAKDHADRANWISSGQGKLNKIVRHSLSTEDLASKIIGFMCGYLDANMGALYTYSNQDKELKLAAGFALESSHETQNVISLGQGLVGQAAKAGRIKWVKDVPSDYFRVASATGELNSGHVLLIPCIYNTRLNALIEIASFKPFSKQEMDFAHRVSETVAVAFFVSYGQARMQQLLEESQRNSEELMEQRAALQSKNVELAEQTQNLIESEEELKFQREELKNANEALVEKSEFLRLRTEEVESKNWEIEQARKSLEQKTIDLEKTSRFKSEFLANMSHELRSPLNSLLLLAKNLAENQAGNLEQKQIESLEIIYKSGSNLLQLINDILDLSKIEAGKLEVNTHPILREELLETMRNYFNSIAEEKGLDLSINSDPDVPETFIGDQQKIEQVLINLLSNAMKFTHEGEISLSVKRVRSEQLTNLEDLGEDPYLMFRVSDTGVGIPEAVQDEIFTAFKQADGSTSRQYGGTGLGLSISRDLASLMRGRILLESQEGEGSVFTFLLPENLSAGIHTSSSSPVSQQDYSRTSGRIPLTSKPAASRKVFSESQIHEKGAIQVLAEDIRVFNFLQETCQGHDYNCVLSSSVEEALSQAEQQVPAAIIHCSSLGDSESEQKHQNLLIGLDSVAKSRRVPISHTRIEFMNSHKIMNTELLHIPKPANKTKIKAAFEKLELQSGILVQKVLLVLHKSTPQKRLHQIMLQLGIEAVTIRDEDQILEILDAQMFDALILDHKFPLFRLENLLRECNARSARFLPLMSFSNLEPGDDLKQAYSDYVHEAADKNQQLKSRLSEEVRGFLSSLDKKKSLSHSSENEPAGNGHGNGNKILLINKNVREIYATSQLLEEAGIETIKTLTAQKALSTLVEDSRIDLLLFDLKSLKDCDSETLGNFQAEREKKQLPILVCLNKGSVWNGEAAATLPVDGVMQRPIHSDQLITNVKKWLS